MPNPVPDNESLLQKIAGMPPKPLRSKLTQYGEEIVKLRERGDTFEEIRDWIQANAGVDVATSTLHNFYYAYTKPKRARSRPRSRNESESNAINGGEAKGAPRIETVKTPEFSEATVKLQVTDASKIFKYNPDEPL